MSKFNNSTKSINSRNTIGDTTNRSGYAAYSMTDKEHLVTSVLTTMFGEEKFYRNTDEDIVKLATECAKNDPEFLAKLAAYARNEMNLRSVSHVLAAIEARYGSAFTRPLIRNIIIRPDDITETMAAFKTMYNSNWPNAMKREIAEQIQKFDEYKLAKYKGTRKDISLRDVLRITHPVPKDECVNNLFNKIVNDTLETPYTWETELSEKGNTKEVWDELIESGKLGYMAMLRNLRNIINCGANVNKVLEVISDPEEVKKSRQLPFRYYAAYKQLKIDGILSNDAKRALEKAISASVDNIEQIKGRTLIAIDTSGSMQSKISAKSIINCNEIATLLGVIASSICEDATVCYFDAAYKYCGNRNTKGYRIVHYGKFEPILRTVENGKCNGGGTDLSLPMKYALEEDECIRPFDRVIYFSDNECNCNIDGRQTTTQRYINQYRNKFNKNFWVHAVDLQGYGTQQFVGDRTNVIAGWSEKVLEFINTAEQGVRTIVNKIENYRL